jgi:superoxide dismutase, Fe-Mn family
MNHSLPSLDYAYDALEPYIDARTMEIHHQRHHQGYIDKLNIALSEYSEWQDKSVFELLRHLSDVPEAIRTAVRNHGGGHANHSFFWPMLKKGVPFGGDVADAIRSTFGSFEVFKERFSKSAATLFGSGWAWLVADGDGLDIVTTQNQDNPLSQGKIPILGIDVWEHAYYLKYQNHRPEYISAFFEVIHWGQVNEYFRQAKADLG